MSGAQGLIVKRFCLFGVALAGAVCAAQAAEPNLLKNGDFAARTAAGLPESWANSRSQTVSVDATNVPQGASQALRVDIVKAAGESLGEIRQTVRVKAGTAYRLDGMIRGTKPKMAMLAVKLRKDGKEIGRLASPWNGKDWTPAPCDINSGEADELQIACRWRQSAKDKVEGQTAWFTALTLVEQGPATAAAAPSTAPGAAHAAAPSTSRRSSKTAAKPLPPAGPLPTGPWTAYVEKAAAVPPVAGVALPLKPASGDVFVTPAGAGGRDGHDWANALPGNGTGVLQAAWDAVTPGHAVRLGSGLYVNLALDVTSGGTNPEAMKRLTGEDTGDGLPWVVGNWKPADLPHGLTFIGLSNGVSHCAFEHLRLAHYQYVVHSAKGRHVDLRFRDLKGYELRYGLYFCGGALADEAAAASHDIEIADCDMTHFTKNGFRFQGGNYDVRLLNCHADAGGKPWMRESFHMGYSIQGDAPRRHFAKTEKPWASDHDLVFVGCTSRNCIWSEDHYWQGDGYCSEKGTTNLVFINCAAFDCADGGWDLKSDNVIFVNCAGVRNKMNWRLWGTACLYNCLSANAFKRGGGWTSDGLWSIGTIHAARMTFVNNHGPQIYADSKHDATAAIALEQCLVGFDGSGGGEHTMYTGAEHITKVDTAEWQPKTDKTEALGPDPEFVNAAAGATWLGDPPDAFDNRRCGASKGYASALTAAWRAKTPEQLVAVGRNLLAHQGWDDLKRRIEAVK